MRDDEARISKLEGMANNGGASYGYNSAFDVRPARKAPQACVCSCSVQQLLPDKFYRRVKLVIGVLFLSESVSLILG